MLDRLAVAAIGGYQQYISPYKGFRCAYRAKRGGGSCSEFVKRCIMAKGLRRAFASARARFAECREAALQLKTESVSSTETTQEASSGPKRGDPVDMACYGCGPCGGPCDALSCVEIDLPYDFSF